MEGHEGLCELFSCQYLMVLVDGDGLLIWKGGDRLANLGCNDPSAADTVKKFGLEV